MKKNNFITQLILLLFLLLAVRCNPGKEEWIQAKSENTLKAYEDFVMAFPKCNYTLLAKNKIDSIYYGLELFPVNIDNKYGFIDRDGQLRIKNRFDYVYDFKGMFALVKDSLFWGIINKKGDYVVQPEYTEISEFSEGLAAIKSGEKWGYADTTGEIPIPYEFDDAWLFTDSLALVKKDDKWGFIDHSGSFVVSPKYSGAYINDKGPITYFVRDGKLKQILTNKNGLVIIKDNYEFLEKKTLDLGFRFSEYWEYTNENEDNQSKETLTDNCIDEFENGIARIIIDDKWGYIDLAGEFVIKPEYSFCSLFNNNIAIIKKNKLYGYIDTTGKVIISPKFIQAGAFVEGFAIVQYENADRLTFINERGKKMTNLKINGANVFSNGLAGVEINGKWGVIDRNFKLVIPAIYDEIEKYFKNFAIVKKGEKWGIIDMKGNKVVDCKYNSIRFKDDLAYVYANDTSAYIDTTGRFIWKSGLPIK